MAPDAHVASGAPAVRTAMARRRVSVLPTRSRRRRCRRGRGYAGCETFGIGPFHVLPVVEQRANYGGEDAHGQNPSRRRTGRPCPDRIDPAALRHSEHLSPSGAAAVRPRFTRSPRVTNDYDGKTAHFKALGYSIAAESLAGRFRVAYVDTAAEFGFYTEVVEAPAGLHRPGARHLRHLRQLGRQRPRADHDARRLPGARRIRRAVMRTSSARSHPDTGLRRCSELTYTTTLKS